MESLMTSDCFHLYFISCFILVKVKKKKNMSRGKRVSVSFSFFLPRISRDRLTGGSHYCGDSIGVNADIDQPSAL